MCSCQNSSPIEFFFALRGEKRPPFIMISFLLACYEPSIRCWSGQPLLKLALLMPTSAGRGMCHFSCAGPDLVDEIAIDNQIFHGFRLYN